MSDTVHYRGYDGSIIHDAVDALYHGKILGISDSILYHGHSTDEAKTMFREAVDDYINFCNQQGKEVQQPFSSLSSTLPHELKVKAALFAQEHETDVESVLKTALSDYLAHAA